ncbi:MULTISPECIES: SDR family NAD(P)-dependent oxidoreductase [Streptomyces]|uniref:SDR family oxidoreductase n=1 Tax=Streptomyces flaveolus TaxID=67297 RepID=A0ABV3AM90_9ACTN|nr:MULTISPECIES: SDR family oxidoreductase [Streptomyces]
MLYLLLVALVSVAVLGIVAFALRGRSDRPWTYGTWAATTTATVFLTFWMRPSGTGVVKCTVSRELLEPFGTTQGWMNVALFARAALPHLRAVGGSIVNVGSVSGLGADWGLAAYNAAKGAVVNLTNAMALDHGSEGVRVNAVHPSLTVTDMARFNLENEDVLALFRQRIPMQRAAEPDEVADVIAFLASPDARFVNGAHIPVDGGLSASNGQPCMF